MHRFLLFGVISGSHYNHNWTVHSLFSEALERLLFERFPTTVDDSSIPNIIKGLLEDRKANKEDLTNIEFDSRLLLFSQMYKRFRDKVREGNYARTAQFWLVYYLDLIAGQHLLHMAIQEKHFYLRLHGLKRTLPFFFALNKQNYARYGSLYSITWKT